MTSIVGNKAAPAPFLPKVKPRVKKRKAYSPPAPKNNRKGITGGMSIGDGARTGSGIGGF
jgi:hypothetical protein